MSMRWDSVFDMVGIAKVCDASEVGVLSQACLAGAVAGGQRASEVGAGVLWLNMFVLVAEYVCV
jgi:hypothetical protein